MEADNFKIAAYNFWILADILIGTTMKITFKSIHHLSWKGILVLSACISPCCILTLTYLCGSVLAPRNKGCREATVRLGSLPMWKVCRQNQKEQLQRRDVGRWQLMIQKTICMRAFCLTRGSMCWVMVCYPLATLVSTPLESSFYQCLCPWGNAQPPASTYLS